MSEPEFRTTAGSELFRRWWGGELDGAGPAVMASAIHAIEGAGRCPRCDHLWEAHGVADSGCWYRYCACPVDQTSHIANAVCHACEKPLNEEIGGVWRATVGLGMCLFHPECRK